MVRWLQSALLTLLLSVAATAGAVEITLRVLPDPPPLNESFTLVFEADGSLDDEPDFTPLEKDFEILQRNQQTALELRNARQRRTTTWRLTVLPKHGPPLVVPAIPFGTQQTAPRQLAMAAALVAPPDEGLFLEAEATPTNPYVQQEVLYTLRLWRRYEISNASLSEPAFSGDAVTKVLTEDRRYTQTRNGQRYEVVERRFMVYPQASGMLTIKPAMVTAQVVKRGLSLFENFAQAMSTRRISANAITLQVRPVPATFPGKRWLPARSLSLSEAWQPGGREANVGEPITRTLSLVAEGLTAGQLPPLELAPPKDWKIYLERPQNDDQQQDGSFQGTMVQKAALVATRAGAATLPAIEIPWWNTTRDQLEFARLDSAALNALPVPDLAPPVPPAPAAAPDQPATASASASKTAEPKPVGASAAGTYWQWLAALCGSGWLLTLFLSGWRPPGRATQLPAVAVPVGRDADHAPRLKAACARAEVVEITAALLAWGADRWPSPPRSLAALAQRVDEPLAQQLRSLDAARYGRAPSPFASAALLADWQHYVRRQASPAPLSANPLPKLYAQGAA